MRGPRPQSPPDFDVVHTPIEVGTTLVEASAGTGKTYSLTTLAVRLLLCEEVDELREILLVTYTEKATAELKDRLRRRLVDALEVLEGRAEDPVLADIFAVAGLDEDPARARAHLRLRLALSAFDEVRVQTLHGFCGQLLRESAFELGEPFTATFVDAATEVEAQAVEDVWRSLVFEASRDWAELLQRIPNIGLEDLRRDLDVLRRHRDARWAEGTPRLEEVREGLLRLADEIRTHWDSAALLARVNSVKKWLKDAVKDGLPASLRRRLEEENPPGIEVIELCSPDGWIAKVFAAERKRLQPWFEEDPLGRLLAEWSERTSRLQDAFRVRALEEAGRRYDAIKEHDQLLDYDDLIEKVYRTVEDPRTVDRLRDRVQSRLSVALIDEFQDTDRRQWSIFCQLFAGRRLVLVGDPKQAIYGFRGADLHTYLRASGEARLRCTLPRNYRSHPELVEAVNRLFGRFRPAFALPELRFPEVHGAIDPEAAGLRGDDAAPLLFDVLGGEFGAARSAVVEAEVLRRLSAQVTRLLSGGLHLSGPEERPLHAGDLAVLVRTGRQGQAVVATLQEAGVPAVLAQLGDIYDSFEMRELEVVLRAVLAPRRHRLRQRAASTLLWGAKLDEVADAVTAVGEPSSAGDDWSDELLRLQECWREQGFVPMCGRLLRQRKVRSRLLAMENGERRWTNLQHAIEILDRDATDEHLDATALVRWISRQRGRGGDDERRQLRLERDAHAVQVLTIHKCKGLQFEVVLCPFLYGPVREPKKGELFVVSGEPLGRDEDLLWRAPEKSERQEGEARRICELVEFENLAEDLRLLYVALTRARRRCVVWTGATGKEASRNALSFLLFGQDPGDDSSPASWWAKIQAQAKDAWQDPLNAMTTLCEAVEGRWQLVGESGDVPAPRAEIAATDEYEAAVFPEGRRLVAARVVSFTSWTRELSPPRAQDHLDPDEERPVEESAPQDLFAFARGARAGLCLHEILERVAWTKAAGDTGRETIGAILERYGLATAEAHAAPIDPLRSVEAMLERVSRLRRPDSDGDFATFSPEQRRAEWPFDAALGQRRRVSPTGLARIFREHARGNWVEEFARRLERLSSQRVHGILTGFVDLVFRDGDRWWVLDWKSNHLGNRLEDYGVAALRRSMLEHDYHLQSHLYLVALHRHLRRTLDDYDPARHLGGSIYVYLRGLGDDGIRGTYVDRPATPLVEALDRALDGEAAS